MGGGEESEDPRRFQTFQVNPGNSTRKIAFLDPQKVIK